jgi:hypothetical protein
MCDKLLRYVHVIIYFLLLPARVDVQASEPAVAVLGAALGADAWMDELAHHQIKIRWEMNLASWERERQEATVPIRMRTAEIQVVLPG